MPLAKTVPIALGKGWNNVAPDSAIAGFAREARNVDILDGGRIVSRRTPVPLVALANAHSLFPVGARALCASDETLYLIDPATRTATPLAGLTPGLRVSYAALDDEVEVWWSNTIETGYVRDGVNQPWGLPVLPSPVATAEPGGGLFAGRYQVAVSLKAASGEEGGLSRVTTVTVPAAGRIVLPALPGVADARVTHYRIYRTQANGDELYWVADAPVGGSVSVTLTTPDAGRKPCETRFLAPPPAGRFLAHYNGRIYWAEGRVLWWTEPMRYGLYRPSGVGANLEFDSEIVWTAAAPFGMYLGLRDRVVALIGEPRTANLVTVSPVPPVPESGVVIDGALFGFPGAAVCWLTARGFAVAAADGSVKLLNDGVISLADLARACVVATQREGCSQLLAITPE